MWYTKNLSINHQKLKAYPLGPKWQWKTTKFCGENKSEHLRIYNQFGLEQTTDDYFKDLVEVFSLVGDSLSDDVVLFVFFLDSWQTER